MRGKKSRKILIYLIIILIIIQFILIFIYKNKDKSEENIIVQNLGSKEINITEKSVTVENFDEIVDNLPMKSITMHNKVQDFSLDFIKDIYYNLKDSTQDKIDEYYTVNEEKIKSYLYNINEFNNIITKLREINSNELIYSQNIFNIESLKETENEITFNMKVIYNDIYDIDFIVHVNKQVEDIQENQILFELVN